MAEFPPNLLCDITLYPTEQGGRNYPIRGDLERWFSCPCKASSEDYEAWDCRIVLDGEVFKPGESRRLEVLFLSGAEALRIFAPLGRFLLWEGRIIGEATIVTAHADER